MFDNFNADLYFKENGHTSDQNSLIIHCVSPKDLPDFVQTLTAAQQDFITSHKLDLSQNAFHILPNFADNTYSYQIIMAFENQNYHALLKHVDKLPKPINAVAFQAFQQDFDYDKMAYLWGAHFYKFTYFKEQTQPIIKLCMPQKLSDKIRYRLRALYLGRNHVNMPAENLTPQALQETVENFAQEFNAQCQTLIGSELLSKNLNLIHAVGRSITDIERQPRLIDFFYETPLQKNAPTITLVGKGVCFDTGGLNIKTGNSMSLMKKDMGGAATILAVALNILQNKPAFNLRILIPAVENNVAGNSFRPSDVFTAYNGKTVEITNTDAEGRLILADALAYAAQDEPDLLVDIATLTGAARVAVGPDLPVLYTNNPEIATDFMQSPLYEEDPVWQLPLWEGYKSKLKGTISDLINAPSGGMAGSITAALFLENFIGETKNWIHFDSYCHVPTAQPAKPKGGDVMPFILLTDIIENFAQKS